MIMHKTCIPRRSNRSPGIVVRIRRSRIMEDGMAALNKSKCQDLKDRLVVRYINDFGEEEMGIDSGGLFKDFITDLGSRVFGKSGMIPLDSLACHYFSSGCVDPSYGLFSLTSTNLLYPNPAAPLIYGRSEVEELYFFAGRLLGKAIFENITLQPQFAHFFLGFMHGHYNFINLIDDLATLDAELYKNLMFLKSYEVCSHFHCSTDMQRLFMYVACSVLGRHRGSRLDIFGFRCRFGNQHQRGSYSRGRCSVCQFDQSVSNRITSLIDLILRGLF